MEQVRSFLLGGIIVLGTSLITKKFSPTFGAIFWSYPVSLIVASMSLTDKERKDTIQKLSYISVVTPMFISCWALNINMGISFWRACFVSTCGWCVISFLAYKLNDLNK